MGTKKSLFWKFPPSPWRLVYATRARVCGASAAHRTGPPPACRSVLAHAPWQKDPPPNQAIKTHFRAHFLQKLSHNLLVHTTNIASRHRTRTFSWFACSSTRQAARMHTHSNPKEPADIAQKKSASRIVNLNSACHSENLSPSRKALQLYSCSHGMQVWEQRTVMQQLLLYRY